MQKLKDFIFLLPGVICLIFGWQFLAGISFGIYLGAMAGRHVNVDERAV